MLGIFLLLTYIFIVDVASASLSSTVVGSVRDHFCDGGAWGSDKVISTSTRINRLSSDQECADYCGRVIYERGFYNSGDVIRHYVSNRNVGTDRKCFCHILEFTTNNHCELAGNHAPNTYYDILYVDTVVSADFQYDLFTSGTCTSNGAVEPSSQAECEAGAIQLGLGDGGGNYGELGYAGSWANSFRPRCAYYPTYDQKVRYITTDAQVGPGTPDHNAICRVVADTSDTRCMCGTNDCSSRTKYPETASYTITSNFGCPAGTEPIQYAEDCLHGFKTNEPFSLIPSFQYCEMLDKSDQVLTKSTQTGNVDEIAFDCYESCIDGQKTNLGGADSDPLFWSKHTKEDVTHFSVTTSGSMGRCVCYATNVDDCKNGDADVPLTSSPHTISYRINHHSHPYDLTTGSYRTIPTLSSLTTGSCQKEFADEVFADKVYRPTISYKASSSVCEEVFEIDGTSVTIENAKIHLGNVYSTRLQETDPLYDRDPSQECANRCDAKANGYDGLMIVSYAPKGNINSCLCGKKCDTPQAGHPYLKIYSMRTVPDPYETDKSQSICHPSPLQLSNYKSDCSCNFGFTGNTCETARMMCLWNGEETDGTECICNDDGELNTKVSKYGCCTKGTYWEQDKYASFTPLSEFEPLPANRFYEDAFLYVCKPPETLLDYESDRERIIDIHNYVANTDEYLLTKPAVCGNAPEKQLFTSTLQTLTSKSPDTFTVTRDTRTIVVDKDKTILELKEGSEPKEQCAAFCVSKNKGYKGFSIFTPTPTFQRSEDGPGHSDMTTVGGLPPHDPPFSSAWCEDDDYVHVYTGWFDSDDEDPNPGRVSNLKGVIDACFAGCTFRPRVSKTKVKGYKDSRPQNFWDVYGPDDISYIRISDSYLYSRYGGCICHTGNLDTCEKVEDPSVHTHANPVWKQYYYHNYKVVRGDTECTCEPFIANMDHQTEFKDPMSYEDNEGWLYAIPRTTERYDIQFPVDIEAEAQNLGCFENIDGRVLKIDQLSGTSHSISAVETAYVDVSSARSSVGGTFEDCYEECKYDDVFTYGFIFPELPRYNFEGKGSCLALDSPFSSTDVSAPFGHSSWVYQVSFSPDGSRFLSASRDRYVRVRDTSTGSVLRTMYTGYYVYSAAWSPDGSKIVSTAQDNKVRVWDSKTGALISTLSGHYNMVFSVSFSPDGQKIVSWSSDATIVWSTETWEKLTTKSGFKVFSFSPTGTTGTKIVSGFDKYVVVTDFEQGTELMRLQGHEGEVNSVSFSPDGSKIVSGSNDKTVRVWDSQTGAQLKNLTGHTGEVNSVVFSPDGSHIVSGSSDKTVRVWDTQTGGLLTTLGGHSKGVLSVSFSPNGTHIVSGSYDNTVRVWSRSLSQGDYLESSVASDASECYKNCRYKAGFSGFVFKPVDDRCVCTTTNQVGCVTKNQLYDRYSVNEDYMHFTEFSDSYCDSNLANYENARLRPYSGGDNPGEDQAAIIRACHEACVDIDGDNIIDSEPLYQNKDYWDEYTGSDATAFYTRTDGRCYCIALLDQYDQSNCEAQSGSGNLGAKWLPGTEAYEWRYKRNPLPEEKTCTCYSGGRDQINSKAISDVFQVTGTSVGTLMTVQKNPAVNPAPCNVNSYIALGDDIVGDPCNCPIGALEEAYVDVGFERAIVNGRCNDYTAKEVSLSKEECENACKRDPHCDSYSYAPEDDSPCRTAIDCAGFEYKFEGLCGWGSPLKPDRAVGVLPNIRACRDRCAEFKGFAYSESYRNCMCQDYEMTGEFHSLCGNGGRLNDVPNTVEQWTRYQHNFEPAAPGQDATIMVKQPLTASKGRYCATGEEDLYTVSITDPRADVYACAQNATLQGMEVARGSVNGLTFTCYVSNTYYAIGDTEAGIAPCGDFKETGGPQYILQAGMQRRIGIELATVSYQNKAIKDDLFNKEIYPSDTPEGCKVHCDPYKYRHFQFSNRDKTCQCIKKEKSLLTLTGDPNDMNYEIYDFSAGLIDSPHEMCFCEGFYLVDGQAQACPAGKYSSKLTPCSAACTNCPTGQFSDAGASECGACVAGQIQTSPTSCSKCPAGKFARSGDIVCRVCEIGTYSIGVGAGRCTLCPTGKFQDPAVVGTTTNTCKDCPEGWEQPNMEQTDCKFCGVGKYTTSEGTAECLVCSSGKYQNQNEQKSADACHDCSAGKYQEQTGKSSCKNCAAGKYQSQTGKTSCPSCSAGKYQGQTGKTSCVTCGAGKFSAAGALSCATCGAGKYSRAGSSTCSACNAGYYQTGAGQGSCTLCPAAATPNYKLGRFWNDVSRWGSVSGYGYSFHYPNPDRTKIDSCLYVQKGDYNLQGSNSAEGFNYDKVHCRYASQNNKINGYIKSKYVLRWCWIDRGNCRDVVNGRLVNYDLTETGRTNGGWKQCKPYHKGYRL